MIFNYLNFWPHLVWFVVIKALQLNVVAAPKVFWQWVLDMVASTILGRDFGVCVWMYMSPCYVHESANRVSYTVLLQRRRWPNQRDWTLYHCWARNQLRGFCNLLLLSAVDIWAASRSSSLSVSYQWHPRNDWETRASGASLRFLGCGADLERLVSGSRTSTHNERFVVAFRYIQILYDRTRSRLRDSSSSDRS